MKRISFLLVALLLMGGMAMAQETRRGGDKQMDSKARAERITERMTKEYSLNEDQKKQLLEANLALFEQPKMDKEAREKRKQEMKAVREAYDAQLKKILTPTQYDAYTKKQAERQKKNR